MPQEYKKSLSQFYHRWYRDCWDSAVYCRSKGDEAKALEYLKDMQEYFDIIINNWDAIEFFNKDGNWGKLERFLPNEFRGYK